MLQHGLVMTITASRAKYSGGETSWFLLLHVYNEDNPTYKKFYKGKGIATSRLYQQFESSLPQLSESPPI